MLNKTLVIDVGTIPNAAAIARLSVPPRLQDGFLTWPLHQLACVSILTIIEERSAPPTFEMSSFSRQDTTEAAIIASVERVLGSGPGALVTFNGRGFDLPLLQMRGAAHGCFTPALRAVTSTRLLRSPLVHTDLLDRLCPVRAVPKVRLVDVCASLAIPSKADERCVGVEVCDDKWDRIRLFCELDVVSTWLLNLTLDCHDVEDFERLQDGWSSLSHWISADQDRFEHLIPFIKVPKVGYSLDEGAILGSGPVDLVF